MGACFKFLLLMVLVVTTVAIIIVVILIMTTTVTVPEYNVYTIYDKNADSIFRLLQVPFNVGIAKLHYSQGLLQVLEIWVTICRRTKSHSIPPPGRTLQEVQNFLNLSLDAVV